MTFSHSTWLLKGVWGGRWCRRIGFSLVSGAVFSAAGLQAPQQSFLDRWIIGKLDALVREETGLSIQAEALEFHVFQGRVILRNASIGGDLLKADRLEVQVDLTSLLGRNPHIRKIEIENPVSVLDAQRLSRIHLKKRPDRGSAPLVTLDQLTVLGGKLRIEEPAWRLPHAEFTYRVYGQGLGPNRISTDIRVPRFVLGAGPEAVDGSIVAKANLSDLSLELKEGEVRVGNSHLMAHGNFAFKERVLATDLKGNLNLVEFVKLLDPGAPAAWGGAAEFKAEVRGSLADPAWKLSIRGKALKSPWRGLLPGDAEITADGSLRHANILGLTWDSLQGKLQASGQWKQGGGSQMQFHCERFGLAPLASFIRVGFLDSLSANLTGNAEIPGNPWVPPRLDAIKVTAEGQFVREGEQVGRLTVHLADGVLGLEKVALKIPEVELEGSGTLKLGKQNLQSITARASARTDASLVANVLHSWDIGEGHENGRAIKLGMSGYAIAQAEVAWNSTQGVRLKGHADVEEPRWHGATMDSLSADVSIQDDELSIENIKAEKGNGGAQGSLWLTWHDVRPGQDEMDMCFQAFHLPIEEGLRAGDVGDLPITGVGSGWARIHGPYNHLWVEASGQTQNAKAYGFNIPFASGDMTYDITGDRLTIRDARVAETQEQMGAADEEPTGLLSLHGDMEMDLKRETWRIDAKGNVDSEPLGLPGPRFQTYLETHLEGPWVSPFGPLKVPLGTCTFSHGRIFLDQQSLEGLQGRIKTDDGSLHVEAGVENKSRPLLSLDAWTKGQSLFGAAEVHVAEDSADTAPLAARLTKDLLKDASLDVRAEGTWDDRGLRWQGQLEHLAGHFGGFDLIQPEPSFIKGDESGLSLDVRLEGQATTPSPVLEPARAKATGTLPFSVSEPMAVRLEGTAELANLKGILDHVLQVDEYSLLADLHPKGSASFDLTLGGPYLQPTVDGLLSLKDGRLEIRTYPQSVEDLSFNLHLKGRDLILLESDPLRGRVAQGKLRAWGVATWDFGGLSKYDLQTRLEDFQLRDLPEGFELDGTLDAVVQGTSEEGGIISGTLLARRMLYQADINLRDLILASAMGGVPTLGLDPNDPFTHIDLDLDLVLGQPWEFDTNLLKLQGRPVGTFKILGTLAEPGFKGKMDILPGGRLTNLLPAGDVVLEHGTLEWTNPRVWFPNLDLQGRVDVSPYVVNLGIHGNLDGVEMRESSTPSLRQDEITAILIDPSVAPNIGALTGTTSQSAINSGMASTGSGLITNLALANFQESVRRTFKLDRVSVAWRTGSGGTAPETSITVGKSLDVFGHLTPFVFTHQKSGDTSTMSGQVEWRFGNVVLQLGISQSGTNGAAPSGEIRHTWSPGW